MPEAIDWLADGTPYSPRFSDRYHSSLHSGLDQARNVFLAGCGLPAAWAGQAQWRVLETGFGLGLNFVVTWAAWRADPERSRILHFTACEAWPVGADDVLRAAAHWATQAPELEPLAQQLAAQFWGLLPGVHRLSFEGGRVLLTLYIGDAQAMLRQQQPLADSVYLDGFSPAVNPDLWSVHTLKAVARCCRRGTRLATWTVARTVRDGLAQCGFTVHKMPGVPPKRHNLQAVFQPHWEPRANHPVLPDVAVRAPARCLVVGAGLAGAGVAASLARRGWQVEVLEQGDAPAAGASGLPAGVFAPHVSPDDSVLSRLSRAGVRTTLQTLGDVAADAYGAEWADCGVLEHGVDGRLSLAWAEGPGLDWSRPATPEQIAGSHLPMDALACWHARGGWVRPPRLVQRLLAQPGVRWRGGCRVARLQRAGAIWQALDDAGAVIAEAELAVVCAALHSAPLIGSPWPLQPLRGQVAWGLHGTDGAVAPWPAQPLNGHGNLVPDVPLEVAGAQERGWVAGSTFERDRTELPVPPAEAAAGHAANLAKLQDLAPALGQTVAPTFGQARTWAAVRCTAPGRLPVTGPVDAAGQPGLFICTGMGARGLTLALLCGELLAARLHAEPLPLEAKLAQALSTERLGTPY